jgi:hypothetical protein
MARIKADSVKGFTKRTWDAAYSRSIKSTTVSGDTNKTISLNQQNGESILIEGITDTNYYVTSGSLSQGTLTLTLNGLTDGVDITGFVHNLSDINDVASTLPTEGQVLKWDGSVWSPATDLQSSGGTGIGLADLSVSVATAGTPNLSYDNTSGTFTYTPPDFSGSYLSTSGGTINGDLTVTGIINVNSATGTSNFANDVSIDGDLSVDGAFTIGTVTGDIRGDVYSIVGATSSVKVLESGSGNNPDTYYIGDLRNSDTDQVFDTSLAMFRKDLKIGDVANDLGGGAENLSLTLGATSKLYFADGAGPEHATDPYTYINATKVSNWDFSVLTSSKFQMGQTTGSPQEDLIQFNINGASGLTSSLSIKPGTYISASTDTDNHVLLDVNNTSLANLYVGKTGGQSMQGPLSITAGNLTVSGNGTFIEGDGKIDIYNTSTTPVKILDHINAWFRGDIRGGDLQDLDGNDLFAFTQDTNDNTRDIATLSADLDMTGSYTDGGSNAAYRDILLNQGSLIKFGNQSIEINGTSVGNWNSAYGSYVRDLDFYSSSTNNYGISITGDESGNYDRDIADIIGQGTAITMSAANGKLTIGATVRNLQSTPITDGLAYYSDITNYFASNNTTIGWVIGQQTTTPDKVNLLLESEDGLVFAHTADDGTQGYDNFVIRNSKGVESFAINDSTGVLTITKTGAGGTGGTLTANLQTYVDSRVSAGAAPSLQEVTASGDNTNHDIHIVGSEQEMLLTRVNSTSGNNKIATFDTFSSQGYIQIGSQINSAQDYGYIGHSSSGLHLSKVSGTGSAIVIDSSDDVSMGGSLSVSANLTTTGVANLDGGIAVDTNFSVNGTNGNVSTSGTLSSGNATITGTLGVTNACNFQNTVTANSLTVTNNSTLNSISLSGDVTPSTDSARSIGTSALRFLNVWADNLNGVAPGSFANKDTTTNQEFDATLIAPDFQLTSDERLKENIIDLKPRKINVDFKEYNFKDVKQTRFGVVAQELEKNHPEFIKESDSGYKSVSYIDLLVAKIVELEDRIKQLENA